MLHGAHATELCDIRVKMDPLCPIPSDEGLERGRDLSPRSFANAAPQPNWSLLCALTRY